MTRRRDEPDLPLFRWKPPQAEVIPFPCSKRVGKIRRTAELLHDTTPKAARAHWRRAVGDIERQMERVGVPDDRIEAELNDFHDAVQNELTRRSYGFARIDGGDVA